MTPPVSSPTKRSIFGGHRERKASVNSMSRGGGGGNAQLGTSMGSTAGSEKAGWASSAAAGVRMPFSQSPLGRGQRQDMPGLSYGQFSKSQSDLHMRGASDFPSPAKQTVNLPPVPTAPVALLGKGKGVGDPNLLHSPNTLLGFSRSVDDLSRDQLPDLPSSKSNHDNTAQTAGTWGEHGMPEKGDWGRPSDTGTMTTNRQTDRTSPGSGGGRIPFSSAPTYQANSALQSTAWHQQGKMSPPQFHVPSPGSSRQQKRMSKLSSSPRDQGMVMPPHMPSLPPAALQLTQSSGRPLTSGVVFEGFLNRHVNLSLPFAQLVDSSGSKGKEKDVGKGWKPYKVLLREGKLFFYKPTGAIADEVKLLFPTGLVTGRPDAKLVETGLSLDDVKRNRLGTQDLLAATSRGSMDQAVVTRPPGRRANTTNDRLSAIADDHEDERQVEIAKGPSWERHGRHPDLALVDALLEPSTWWARIEGGTLEAIAHEYVFATQMNQSFDSPVAHEDDAEGFLYAALVAILRSTNSLLRFLEELNRWTVAALNLEKDDERFGSDETKWQTFRDSLGARISLVVKSDIVNMVSGRDEIVGVLEALIRATWAQDIGHAEAELASVLGCNPAAPCADWIGQDRGGDLTRFTAALRPSALLSLEPSRVARQIHIFTADHIKRLGLPPDSFLRLLHCDHVDSIRLLSFDWDRPHFLTRLVLDHILQSSGSLEGGGALYGAKLRASLLRHWIAVASYLLKLNNVGAWCAICVALCSRAVARLGSSWRFVASNDRALVGTVWAPILVDMGWSEVGCRGKASIRAFLGAASTIKSSMSQSIHGSDGPDTLPYLGSALVQTGQPGGEMLSLRTACPVAMDVLALTKQWRGQLHGASLQLNGGEAELQKALQSLCALNSKSGSFDADQTLRLSLQLESPKLGTVDLQWRLPLTASEAACASSPLVFPDSLPHLALLEREQLEQQMAINGGTESNAFRRQRLFSTDTETTITGRSAGSRPALNASPMARSKTFSARMSREVPYGSIVEWVPGMELAENKLIRVGTDLILVAAPEQGPSLPSSPTTSKRFSQEMSKTSRPVSQVSKRSSLPASNRSSVIDSAVVQVQVMIKAATLERLVDVLVLGLQHVVLQTADDNLERNLTPPPRRTRLSIDLPTFRKDLLATYRSFCSPFVLFNLLRKRFEAAVDASRELGLPAQHRSSNFFPTWSRMEAVSSLGMPVDWDTVASTRSAILGLLSLWITLHPQDFADNNELYAGFHSLVEDASSAQDRPNEDTEWEKTATRLGELLQQVRLGVMTCAVRLADRRASRRSSKRASKRNSRMAAALQPLSSVSDATLDFDRASPHELVEYLESVARVFFEKIEEKDLQMASELFVSRSSDPTSWFIAKNSSSSLASQHPDEMPQVNNMYKLLELIRWSRDGPALSHRLASVIRDACAAQNLLRGWIAVQIIEARIGVDKRQARIEKLIDAVWICRARMINSRLDDSSSTPAEPNGVFKEPTVASFVECLIVGSLTSSESRLFTRAWQGVAASRKGRCDNLTSLYPSGSLAESYRESTLKSCTPDIGWILKMVAEALARASMDTQGDSMLVDFEKFRTAWTIIESSLAYKGKAGSGEVDQVELAGARLTAMQSALRSVTWERRAFKEDAAQEATNAPPLAVSASSIMRGTRPLTEITTAQQDKHRRDRRALEMIEHAQQAKRHQQAPLAPSSVSQQPQSRSLSSPPQGAQTSGQTPTLGASLNEKKTRRMTALFRGAVRPMGLIGSSSEKTNSTGDQISHSVAELLTLTPTQKASVVLSCGSSQVNAWYNGQRSFVFHLSAVDGGHTLLQATSQRELTEWCDAIEKASNEYALPPPAGLGAEGKGRAAKKGVPPVPLYGTDIKLLMEHEKGAVPLGLLRMLEEVESRGLREQGIYRISGAKNAIESLKQAFSKQPADAIDLAQGEFSDIHTIAGAIKQWFRDLPEPAVPYAFYHRIIEAERIEGEEDRLYAIRDIVWDFPKPHFDLLGRICQHLSLVCDEGAHNLMAPHNIGLVFGTSLLNPPPGPSSVAESFGNIGKAAHIVKIIVTMHDWLFEPEPDPELEEDIAGVDGEAGLARASVDQTERAPGDDNGRAGAAGDETVAPFHTEQHADSATPAAPFGSSSDDFREQVPAVESKLSVLGGQGAPRHDGASTRERIMIESVYLDATEAIAVLQDPFDDEDEEDEEGEEEEMAGKGAAPGQTV